MTPPAPAWRDPSAPDPTNHGVPALNHVLYLHGFRSSPASFKARMLEHWLGEQSPQVKWACPQLPPSPAQAWHLIRQLSDDWPAEGMAVIGSSLGGYYATALAEARGCRALVLNPAVDPARDLQAHIGLQTQYHQPDEHFEFRPEYIDELRSLCPKTLTWPQRYGAIIARGDELLDWREMATRYAGADMLLLEGSDHALSDFGQHLPWVQRWLAMGQSAR
jgi:predicted esterase YcpF (UPF0227 family)